MIGKVVLWILGILMSIFLVATGLFFLTDNRYKIVLENYNDFNEAVTMDLSFESRIGQEQASLGIRGNTVVTTPEPRQSLTGVYLQSSFLNDPRIFDLYTEGDDVYHHYNLPFLPWQKGMPILQEDGFNPAVFGESFGDIDLWNLFRFSYILEREETDSTLDFYTTDYFTNEEFKSILTGFLGMNAEQVENYKIRNYDIRFSFDLETNQLEEITISFTQQVNELILDSYFKLMINELTQELRTIVVPNGVKDLE